MTFDIVINPAGASGNSLKLWKKLRHIFDSVECRLHYSSPERPVSEICRRLTAKGRHSNLVIIGGDGTLNEALNGIDCFEETTLGFIPCGTGNDMCRDMDLPKSKKKLAERILQGKVRREADIGELTFYSKETVKRRFNISSDVGFGAATCAYADRSRIKPLLNRIGLGRLIYLIGALGVCFTSKPADVLLSVDGRKTRCPRCLCIIVMNHCYEGGGFKFCPHADFTDGKLDIVYGDGLSKLEFLRMLPNAYKGTHIKLRGITELRGNAITICSKQPLWMHTDGEVLGKAKRAEMRLLPQKLRLLV